MSGAAGDGMKMDEAARFLPHFLDETVPLVDALGAAMVALEARWSEGDRDPAAERRALGDVHTIKGNGAMMGFDPIQQVAHALEDLLDAGTAVDARAGALLVRGADLLQALVQACDGGVLDPAPAAAYVSDVAARLAGTDDVIVVARPLRLSPVGKAADSIRVPFQRLDDLAALAGLAAAGDVAAARVLHRALLELRHVSLAGLFDRFGRHVRELARVIGQPLELAIHGGDATVDKAIADRLGEPLLHVVRNAAAHGVEPLAERTAAGKSAVATIAIRAEARGNRVVVSVADDGRGLDVAAIVARARRLGVDTSALPPHELPQLVFLPGLSTAPCLSPLAGRGVGLDVVATSIRALGGAVGVASTPGQGARFWFDLPRTLSSPDSRNIP
ncbi:MAG TPA: ATP-binding protein [Kofleriaceae bacterium]|nr:ATP-binding protein [Kofleriaceae bacterium]